MRFSDLPPSLRSARQELTYLRAKQSGKTKDISTINGERFYGLKKLYNDYELDMVHQKTDMLMAHRKGLLGFIAFWVKLGYIYYTDKHDGYHQLILNFKATQSQPQVAHAHRARFYESREQFKL